MKRLIISIFLTLPLFLNGQDSHFSNMYAVRSIMNPALSSAYVGQSQAIINYRQQWSSLGRDFPFQSYAFQLSHKIELENYDLVAFELRGLKDQAPGNAFVQNQILLGLNYKKLLAERFNNSQFISFGFSAGIGQNKANWNGLWFGNQFNFESGVPDFNLESGEEINTLLGAKTYPDLNIGLVYEAYYHKMSLSTGMSLSHSTRPNISFAPGLDIMYNRKIIVYASFNFWKKQELRVVYSPMYIKHGVFHEIINKIGLTYVAPDIYDISFGLAVAPRMVQNFEGMGVESLSFQIFIEKRSYRFTVAYDATMSRLSDFNSGRGGFEFSFASTRLTGDGKSPFERFFHFL